MPEMGDVPKPEREFGHADDDRIGSVDALRGTAVLIFILSTFGVSAFRDMSRSPFTSLAAAQLSPSIWDGATLADFCEPIFLVMVGTSLHLATEAQLRQAESRMRIWARLWRRAAILYAIGFLIDGGLSVGLPEMQFVGVLQRIALCSLLVGGIHLVAGWKVEAALAGGLVLAYTLTLRLAPVPGFTSGEYSIYGNPAAYVDQRLLPGGLHFGTWDPHGVLTSVPALSLVLFGALLGRWLASRRRETFSVVGVLLFAGIATLDVGYGMSYMIPINAYLLTLPFVLVAVALASGLLAILHFMTAVPLLRLVVQPLVHLGRNSLAIIVLAQFVMWSTLAELFVGGEIERTAGGAAPVVNLAAEIILIWLAAYALYRKRAFFVVT